MLCLLFFLGFNSICAQFLAEKKELKTFNGFFNFHYSETDGEIYLEVDKLDTENVLFAVNTETINGELRSITVPMFIATGCKLVYSPFTSVTSITAKLLSITVVPDTLIAI